MRRARGDWNDEKHGQIFMCIIITCKYVYACVRTTMCVCKLGETLGKGGNAARRLTIREFPLMMSGRSGWRAQETVVWKLLVDCVLIMKER